MIATPSIGGRIWQADAFGRIFSDPRYVVESSRLYRISRPLVSAWLEMRPPDPLADALWVNR